MTRCKTFRGKRSFVLFAGVLSDTLEKVGANSLLACLSVT